MRLVCPECGCDRLSARYVRLVSETFTFEQIRGHTVECSTGEEEIVCSDEENDGMYTCNECSFEMFDGELITEDQYNEKED